MIQKAFERYLMDLSTTTKKAQINDNILRWKKLTTDLTTEMATEKQFYQKVKLYDRYGDGKFNPSP